MNKYTLLKVCYILSLPSLWLISLLSGKSMAYLSLQFATFTQSSGFRKWLTIQCQIESSDFTSPLTNRNKNYCGMRPNPRSHNKQAYGFAKYGLYIGCAIDLLQWYEAYGKPVQDAVDKGFSVMDLPKVIDLLLNTKYIITTDVVGYANNLTKFYLTYDDGVKYIWWAEIINLLAIVTIVYYWNKIARFWRKQWFYFRTRKNWKTHKRSMGL